MKLFVHHFKPFPWSLVGCVDEIRVQIFKKKSWYTQLTSGAELSFTSKRFVSCDRRESPEPRQGLFQLQRLGGSTGIDPSTPAGRYILNPNSISVNVKTEPLSDGNALLPGWLDHCFFCLFLLSLDPDLPFPDFRASKFVDQRIVKL